MGNMDSRVSFGSNQTYDVLSHVIVVTIETTCVSILEGANDSFIPQKTTDIDRDVYSFKRRISKRDDQQEISIEIKHKFYL